MESGKRWPNLVKMSEADFRLDEPWQNIRELGVYDGGEQIGSVEELYAERGSRLPRFPSVSAGASTRWQEALPSPHRGG